MSKFLSSSVGESLTAANLQAGYQAGVVSAQEMDEIAARMPGMASASAAATATSAAPQLRVSSIESIRADWQNAVANQPWHVQKLCNLAGPTVIELVAKLQEKAVRQANAMTYINNEAARVLQSNETIARLLLSSSASADSNSSNNDNNSNDNSISSTAQPKLRFNNTRAKYETDRKVWSASMDVFVANDQEQTLVVPQTTAPTSAAQTALAAMMESTDGDNNDSDLSSSFLGRVEVLDPSSSSSSSPMGLVNAYFVPDEEIKILVVEIDGVLHNVTWKGLDG